MEIQLDDTHVATVKEVDELTSGDVKAVNREGTVRFDPETSEPYMPGDISDRAKDALLKRIIISWSLQHPLPDRRPDSLDKLTLTQMKNLHEGIKPHLDAITEAGGGLAGRAKAAEDPTSQDSQS